MDNDLVCHAVSYETASGHTNFLNRDPMNEHGGINLYAFVANNPVNDFDFLGLTVSGSSRSTPPLPCHPDLFLLPDPPEECIPEVICPGGCGPVPGPVPPPPPPPSPPPPPPPSQPPSCDDDDEDECPNDPGCCGRDFKRCMARSAISLIPPLNPKPGPKKPWPKWPGPIRAVGCYADMIDCLNDISGQR